MNNTTTTVYDIIPVIENHDQYVIFTWILNLLHLAVPVSGLIFNTALVYTILHNK